MNKDFIPDEQALALKELGFDEPCFGFYFKGEEDENFNLIPNGRTGGFFGYQFDAPTYSQAFRWLKNKHGLYGWVTSKTIDENKTIFIPQGRTIPDTMQKGLVVDIIPYVTFKDDIDAQLECLKVFIKIVKEKLGSVK
jgi:hypothetical protein